MILALVAGCNPPAPDTGHASVTVRDVAEMSFVPEDRSPWEFGWAITCNGTWIAASTHGEMHEGWPELLGRVWVAPREDWDDGPGDLVGRTIQQMPSSETFDVPSDLSYGNSLALDPSGAPRLAVGSPEYSGARGLVAVFDLAVASEGLIDAFDAQLQFRSSYDNPTEGQSALGVSLAWMPSEGWEHRALAVGAMQGSWSDWDDFRGRVGFVDPAMTGTFSYDAIADAYIGKDQWGAGQFLATGGDTDGDGAHELLIFERGNSALSEETGPGVVHIVSHPPSGFVSLADEPNSLVGMGEHDDAGLPAIASDINGDGYDDVLVGGPSSAYGGARSGSAWLVLAPVIGEVSLAYATAQFDGEPFDFVGRGAAGPGDLDGDGLGEVAVGASGDPYHQDDRPGSLLVWRGSDFEGAVDREDAWVVDGVTDGDQFGLNILGPGDLTGDGVPDILTSSPYAAAGKKPLVGGMWLLSGASVAW